MALDDVSEKNGCLFFMPGSHNDAELGRAAGGFGNINSIFQESDYPEWSEREMVPMVLNAGDATFREQRNIACLCAAAALSVALARRLRHDGARRRGEHDPQATPRDDLRIHARR